MQYILLKRIALPVIPEKSQRDGYTIIIPILPWLYHLLRYDRRGKRNGKVAIELYKESLKNHGE
ncbi:MAG: hypothetical protein O8C64_03050 [Candidatus Methanoperedens sp.]|nr:hypothetical protein [Candidatus Methanoperedens sp.]MCZ7406281.1 hypothetical protein [Candidatus Methanoperedens sp.]